MLFFFASCVQVDSLSKALSFSQQENLQLKTQIAKVSFIYILQRCRF